MHPDIEQFFKVTNIDPQTLDPKALQALVDSVQEATKQWLPSLTVRK